ncbi:MAG: hypothetical protein J7L77_04360 [Clostridiales bacterium]|nr:hypothetical protein [Clostridiales bacterium]
MPEIPRYNRQQTIPGRVANPGVAGANAGAGQALIRPLENITTLLQNHVQKIEQQDNANEQLLLGAQFDDDLRKFKQEEQQKTGSDSFKNIERGKQFVLAMKEKYKKLTSNEVVKQGLSKYITLTGERLLDSLAVHQSQQRKIVTQQATSALLNGFLKDAYTGEDFKTLITKFHKVLAHQNSLGSISEEEAVVQGTKAENAIVKSYLDGLIDRDPSKAIETIEKGTYDSYLKAEDTHAYHQKAIALEKAMIKDAAKRKKEQETQKAKELKEVREKTGNEFLIKNLNGELTRQDVINSNLKPTGENSKASWIKAIEDREKKLKAKDTSWKTDPKVLAALQTAIVQDPEAVKPIDIMNLQGKNLSTSDAKALIKFRKSLIDKTDPLKSQEAKAAYTRLRSAKTDNLFDSEDQENDKKWANAVSLLTAFIKNHPNEDPQDFVDELLEPAKDGFLRKLFRPDTYQSEEEKQAELQREAGLLSESENNLSEHEKQQETKKDSNISYKRRNSLYIKRW